MFTPIIIGVITLSVIIITHELGHFIAAKSFGVKVEEFGIGFPPRLLGIKRGETVYSLNAIPFGGFNKLAGEEDPEVPRSLAGKSRGIRLLVLGGGSVMNILLAVVLFSLVFMIPRDVITGQVLVEEVAADSPAAMAGISPGDIILSVNNEPVRNNNDLYRYIQNNRGEETTLLIQHADSTRENVRLIPRLKPPADEGAIGVAITTVNTETITQSFPVWQAVPMGIGQIVTYLVAYKESLGSLFSGEETASFFGPVGIAQLTGEVAEIGGIRALLDITGFISLLIGIFNLFPLPAIDGGRITFVVLEWVRRGKRVSPKTEGLIHIIGMALLLVFLFALTYQDIVRVISGESLIP
ncbi:MAG: M50 family metallopeptidase [Dehalococcoidales bacterium]|nr:M50 family metallopeptidase [Dehalococcoidales bacterium]